MKINNAVVDFSFYFILFAVGIATFAVHEFAHWITGVSLGYEMLASPNHVWPKGEATLAGMTLIAGAGPIVTIIQGGLGFFLVRNRSSLFGFSLLYMAFFMRLVAAGASIFSPNDEAKVSTYLGLGQWTIHAVVVIALFILTYVASRQLKLSLRVQFLCYFVASLAVALVVGIDHFFFYKI